MPPAGCWGLPPTPRMLQEGRGCPCVGTPRAEPGWGWGGRTELLWQRLACEPGWFVHVSLGSLVYFFKVGGLFFKRQSPFV